jgi:hypothetical protein
VFLNTNTPFEMDSGAVIYIPSFIRIGSGIRKLVRGIHRQQDGPINLLSFFQNKESSLKCYFREKIYWNSICLRIGKHVGDNGETDLHGTCFTIGNSLNLPKLGSSGELFC